MCAYMAGIQMYTYLAADISYWVDVYSFLAHSANYWLILDLVAYNLLVVILFVR